ncbi:2-oxo-4-hydroxy-4-carboxy-5-ureidoimidazoline decarboxylase [Curvibacter sp. CHRR-16]|uniref:2-oxo-4-hydroxy-4-carboxy-5-ureidoimidazoline decarboxylase n=1 Tax=Curvibacter sp. CHRR-16 TaxID=2835872 RepID=UPI001BDB4843|nr:2-oxo-4-hydroxy-4-carboxy-5-ureidoimidazoline decarboxylase [Curvibacter sp. CHRR-16]MBT0569095.1 2-oxo-4-hydroxy-4-carboxy-5-ureidoimidazoline decarboxylase [Curvibacter sp. CHRR-16]
MSHPSTITLEQLNTASPAQALAWLDGLYEHSPWIAEQALTQRPFVSVAALKWALVQVVRQAGREAQLALLRAHPELAGKAMVSQNLTAESSNEQSTAGLTHCSPEEFALIQSLNAQYNQRFGHPFILAVRGPRGLGLSRQAIIATLQRRLHAHPDDELAECLRQVHRIAEIRLNDKLGLSPSQGQQVWDWQETLAQFSEPDFAEQGQLTVTYLSDAHRQCAQHIAATMQACGLQDVHVDAVGNVVGRYPSCYEIDSCSSNTDKLYKPKTSVKTLLTGSHYDTVRNGGKYDGRLGIYVPLAAIAALHQAGQHLPFGIEVVAFAEEEGQRYNATFLGSSALVGRFDAAWLDQQDAQGIPLRQAMQDAGLRIDDIPALRRDPAQYLGFVEVHIEQGPVLHGRDLPLGVVTSINASARYQCEVRGTASHAGTTPMGQRRDAAAAAAEMALAVEARASQDGDSVGTVGMLQVPSGSINVVPGRCLFSLDLRAPSDAQRDALQRDVLAQLQAIAERRGVQLGITPVMQASAAPSDATLQAHWERAVATTGLPVFHLPSGAGHDAMMLHNAMPQAMLFVRGQNGGISHNPLESTTCDDMQLAVEAFGHLLQQLSHTSKP